jgi:hypothetical protein
MAKKIGQIIKKSLKVIVGLALIAVGILSYLWWWPDLLVLVKGSLGLFVAFIGLIVIMVGLSD